MNYTWNGSVCVAETKTFNCDEKPEPGTLWNTVSSYDQTWDGSNWMPLDSATHHNETPDTQSCRFKCYSMYSWDGEECVSDGYCGDGVVHNDRSLHSGISVVHFPLDEGEGAVANDISGHGNNGTILGNPSWVNGRFGKALSFDGIDDRINWGYSGETPEDNFTMMAWVKTSTAITLHSESNTGTSGTSGQRYVFYPAHGGEGCPWAGAGISVGTNGIIVAEHCAAYAPPIAVYSGNIGSGWNHIAVTYTNKQPRIYLNGKLVRTGYTSTQSSVRAPQSSGNGWDFFVGTIDDIRIFDRSLSNSEIRGFVTGPVMALSMDEPTGNIAFDSSGNGNNGMIYGSSRVAGHSGSAIQFDSVSDYITLPASNSIVSDESGITISLWVKADSVQASQPRITSLFRSAGLTGFNIGIIDSEWASYSATDDGGTWLKSGVETDSDWHHIVATNDGTTHRIYIDGIERNSRDQGFSVGATAAVIGRATSDASLAFKGIVDEVRIYNRAISGSEVLSENLEFCDGASGVMACSSVNPFFNSGDVTCNDDCGFDFSDCGYCGDGIVNDPEECDTAFSYTTEELCESIYGPQTFYGTSTAECTDECAIAADCHFCGDGIVNGPEQCDGGPGCNTNCTCTTTNDGKCYYYNSTPMTWQNAQNWCAANFPGGNLVTLNSSADNTFVKGLSSSNFWIGLKDNRGESVSVGWSHGSCSGARTIHTSGGRYSGTVDGWPNDYRFFKITPTVTGYWVFRVAHASRDIRLSIGNSSCGNLVTTDPFWQGSNIEAFVAYLIAGTTYSLRIQNYDWDGYSSTYTFDARKFTWASGELSTWLNFRWGSIQPVSSSVVDPLYELRESREPNHSPFPEDCVHMRDGDNTNWNDINCNSEYPFVCQW